jgi:hypothetical protein
MEEKSKNDAQAPDRNLGDEWAGWVGDLSNYEKQIEEGKGLFIRFYTVALLVLTAIIFIAYYLVSPRIYAINSYADLTLKWIIIVLLACLYLWSILIVVTVETGRNFVVLFGKSGLHVERVMPLLYSIANLFKISKDRIGNSFIKVNNALIYATKAKFKSEKLLVLLPRCLKKETREKTLELANKYGCTVFTATGGSSARQMVKKIMPDAIIGVACERDLISGMTDSPHSIAIIAIPNSRPEGPCKNTDIDIAEYERAIKFLLKIQQDA